jgi:hypothetical protein
MLLSLSKKRYPLPLTLFVLRVLADHAQNALALDDLAMRAHSLDRTSYFHCSVLVSIVSNGFARPAVDRISSPGTVGATGERITCTGT